MAKEFYYDDHRLLQMFEELSEKRRVSALRGAFRAVGRQVRRRAVEELRGSGLNSNRYVEKGIRLVPYKRVLGFRVTIGTKGKKRDYGDLSGKELSAAKKQSRLSVVPLWAEGGTDDRQRSTKRGKTARTGRMPVFGFMSATESAVKAGTFSDCTEAIGQYIEKTAKKYGSKYIQ